MSSKAFMSQQVSDRQLDAMLNAFLDKMVVAAEKKSLTDAEALKALSTEATLKFAESKPCWLGEEL